MSSQKLSEIQSHSMSFGSSIDERSWSSARAGLATGVVPGAGELLDGVYGEQTLFAVSLHHALGAAGADDLRERVPHVQVAVYAGQILGFAVGRLEPYVADSDKGEPLEDAVGTDERGDELGVGLGEDVLGRDRVDSPEWLVHQHDRGVRRQRPCYPHALLLAARELGRIAAAVLLGREADELQELVHSIPDAAPVPAEQVGDGADVVG